MKLFPIDSSENLIPYDGELYYYPQIFSTNQSEQYFEKLYPSINWKNDIIYMFGKEIVTKRKVAWFADKNFAYSYSNSTKIAQTWTKELLEIKKVVEDISQQKYNSCLLNLYHDGSEGMSYHSDNEKTLIKNSSIASVSFGAERKFSLKHKESKQSIHLMLENGSLLLMQGEIQNKWLHSLPKTKKVKTARINLTFRQFQY